MTQTLKAKSRSPSTNYKSHEKGSNPAPATNAFSKPTSFSWVFCCTRDELDATATNIIRGSNIEWLKEHAWKSEPASRTDLLKALQRARDQRLDPPKRSVGVRQ